MRAARLCAALLECLACSANRMAFATGSACVAAHSPSTLLGRTHISLPGRPESSKLDPAARPAPQAGEALGKVNARLSASARSSDGRNRSVHAAYVNALVRRRRYAQSAQQVATVRVPPWTANPWTGNRMIRTLKIVRVAQARPGACAVRG